MTDPNPTDSAVCSIQRLTIAVWVLCGLTTLNICLSLLLALFPLARFWLSRSRNIYIPNTATYKDQYSGFHEWPLEKQIQKASVIAIGRYETEKWE